MRSFSFERRSRSWGPWFLCVLGYVLVVAASSAAPLPGGFELLEEVRRVYESAEEIRDFGQITVESADGRTAERYFELVVLQRADRYLLRFHGGYEEGFREQVVWRNGADSYHFDSGRQQYREVQSIAATLAHSLVDEGLGALMVPILAAGSAAPLADPDAVAVDGPFECESSSCYELAMSQMAGTIETILWIDTASSRIKRIELELTPPGNPDQRTRITVLHRPESVEDPSAVDFEVPDDCELVADFGPLDLEPTRAQFSEVITVEILSVVARIVGPQGVPLIGLKPSDVVAKVGREEVRVTGLDWYGPAEVGDRWSPEASESAFADRRRGADLERLEVGSGNERTVVLFIQSDFVGSRIKGQMKAVPLIRQLIEGLGRRDRLALFTYTRHLELWVDFTTDRSRVTGVLDRAIRPAAVPLTESAGVPSRFGHASLLEYFDRRRGREIASPEKAVEYVGEVLSRIPGEKELLYLGYGLTPEIGLSSDWWDIKPAVESLRRANTTVFMLDNSQADFHTLEVGLRSMAQATGGTYASLFRYGEREVKRVAQTISGHFVITIDRGSSPAASGKLSLTLRNHKGTVLFSPRSLG